MEICKSCNKNTIIANKHFELCFYCNKSRLQKNKKVKSKKNNKSLFVKDFKSKDKEDSNLHKDEAFYLECFNKSNHKCEECSEKLPRLFRIEKRIVARWRYSHIIAKSIAPDLRHNIYNINILCSYCHERWENGDKTEMKIFNKNLKRFPQYLEKYNKNKK